MNVSPLDLRQPRFRSAFRGFDKVEVLSFLAAAADDYEQALRDADQLRQDMTRLEAVLNEHREHEKSLQSTMLTAQKLADDMRENAQKVAGDVKDNADLQAQRIIDEAEARSEIILEKTQARLEEIQREIDGMRLKRKDVEMTIGATIQILRNTLEFVREQDIRERDDKVLLHRPRHAEAEQPPDRRRAQSVP